MRPFYLLILLTFCECVFGQTPTYVDAKPSLKVTCPEHLVSAGDEFTVEAIFASAQGGEPRYQWSVNAGTIVRGQGTPSLRVRADLPGVAVTASLEIGRGPFWSEPLTETCTTGVASKPEAKLLERFGVKNIGYVELMFDGLFADLWNDPSAQGVVGFTWTSTKQRNELKRWAERLIKMRKFDSSRLTLVDGGRSRSATFSLWLVPVGGEIPIDPAGNVP